MLRSLLHYWRIHLATALGAAVAAAVLTGALLMGDSVRGSLRDLTLQRLGRTEIAVQSLRYFRAQLGADLAAALRAGTPAPGQDAAAGPVETAPVIRLPATAVHGTSGARAARLHVNGVGEEALRLLSAAADFFPPQERAVFPPVVLNAALAAELGARPGDDVVLSFEAATDAPRDSLLGERDPALVLSRIRARVAAITPDRGTGRFSLTAGQATALNAFLPLAELQRVLSRQGQANTLLVAGSPTHGFEAALRRALTLADVGLQFRRLAEEPARASVESDTFIVRPSTVADVERTAGRLGLAVRQVQTYLANRMQAGGRSVPYSTVTAVDALDQAGFLRLLDASGRRLAPPPDDAVVLNAWAAERLQVGPGDVITMTYFVYGPREELDTAQVELTVAAVASMEELGADGSLTADYPGIQDAEDMSAWDPPFPVDLAAIGEADENYWDRWKGTPKAFVNRQMGRRLWTTRYGDTTALRLAPAPGRDWPGDARLNRAILEDLDLPSAGVTWRPVRDEGLAAASGATDFSGLFIAFSFFLILSAALLVGLLFSLGVENRAGQLGLLLATGFPLRKVRRRFLGEGALVAAAGTAVGVACGVAYAAGLLHALRTVWRPAVGSSELFLHLRPVSLVTGYGVAMAVVVLAMILSVRRLARLPVPVLLAGATRVEGADRSPWLARLLFLAGAGAAGLLVLTAVALGRTDSPGLAFGTGAALLTAGLAAFALWTRTGGRRQSSLSLVAMAARNSAWNPGRSILSVALVGCASFIIFTVSASRQAGDGDLRARDSGAGGFVLLGETSVPVFQDLGHAQGRQALGLDEALLAGTTVMPFRMLPGEDASCLNLYQPQQPTILGAPEALLARGGFGFTATSRETDDPWSLLSDDLGAGVVPAFADAHSAQWILHKALGEDLIYEDEAGGQVHLRLVGLLDRSIFQGEVIIGRDRFLEHFPSRAGARFFLLDTPEAREGEVTAHLEERLDRFGMDVTTTARRLAAYRAVENTYLSTFQTLGGFGLLLGTVGLGVVLLRNVLERRRELATLRAFGYRRRRIVLLVLAENAWLLVAGLVTGSGAAFLAVLPRILAGSAPPPGSGLLLTLGAVLLVGLTASAAAVAAALRTELLPALKADR